MPGLYAWHPVASPMISDVGYDAPARVLAVRFRNGAVYHYAGVPWRLYSGLRHAFAPGRFFDKCIRGRFPSQRMTGECERCGRDHVWFGDPCPACGHNSKPAIVHPVFVPSRA